MSHTSAISPARTGPASVVVTGLHHRFGSSRILAGIDLTVHGGIVAVLGANGAGKTTLLRCLATVLEPDDGTVSIDGLDPTLERQRIEIRHRLGYLPQEFGASAGATVFDTLDVIAVLKGIADDRRRQFSVFESLERVGLRDVAVRRASLLSTGMRRRLGLAAALLGEPTLLVLDEPTGGLDPDERVRLREIVAERRRETTVVVSTHLAEEAAVCDQVVVLAAGIIAFRGRPDALAAQATGRSWVQDDLPPPGVRASWRLASGGYRCLGTPPPGAHVVPPTIEDGYLLVVPGAG